MRQLRSSEIVEMAYEFGYTPINSPSARVQFERPILQLKKLWKIFRF
jgi:hypothetical protein